VGELDFIDISVVAAIGETLAAAEASTDHHTSPGLAVPADQKPRPASCPTSYDKALVKDVGERDSRVTVA
jgi:hypothetical protein